MNRSRRDESWKQDVRRAIDDMVRKAKRVGAHSTGIVFDPMAGEHRRQLVASRVRLESLVFGLDFDSSTPEKTREVAP